MSMSHNQMAYVAIVSTLIFGSLFVGANGFFQTSEGAGDFDPAYEDDLIGDGTGELPDNVDYDKDGLPDVIEELIGTKFDDNFKSSGKTKQAKATVSNSIGIAIDGIIGAWYSLSTNS